MFKILHHLCLGKNNIILYFFKRNVLCFETQTRELTTIKNNLKKFKKYQIYPKIKGVRPISQRVDLFNNDDHRRN